MAARRYATSDELLNVMFYHKLYHNLEYDKYVVSFYRPHYDYRHLYKLVKFED